jgi:polyhydroxybutyrate depolymerase
MFFHSLMLAALGAASAQTCINKINPGTSTQQITVGSVKRTFDLYVPYELVDNEVHPAVFMWHGYSSSPAGIAAKTKTIPNAESYKWYAVFPKGTGLILSFNGAGCCVGNTQDDVGFARAIIAWLQANTCVDAGKVFSSGFSNGGFMTHRLACEASDVFHAFAPHSGLMEKEFATTCAPEFNRPILSFHGLNDGVVPYFGNGNWNSFSSVMGQWATFNQCGPDTQVERHTRRHDRPKFAVFHSLLF